MRTKTSDLITTINPKIQVKESKMINFNDRGKSDEKLKYKFSVNETVARISDNQSGSFYRVLIDRNNKLYNPSKKGPRYSPDALDKLTNSNMFKFREVTKECFDIYIAFLKTKETSLLLKAERSI